MSVIQYNGVVLPYAFFTNFDQQPLYDDQGGVDWYVTKFDIKAQAVLNFEYLGAIAPELVGRTTNPADIAKFIRERLLQPRRILSVQFNGVELLPQRQVNASGTMIGTGEVDAKNGPQPQSCTLTQLTNTTFLATFHIVAHYWENTAINASGAVSLTNRRGGNVLFNRWTESQQIDDCNYSIRVREGKFMIRSDNAAGLIADRFRPTLAILAVPQGFLRQNAKYTVSPDGLGLQYHIEDKEFFKRPPEIPGEDSEGEFSAYRANGEYTESSPQRGGVLRFCEARVALSGDKRTPQWRLLQMAIAIAASKVNINAIGRAQDMAAALIAGAGGLGGGFAGTSSLVNAALAREVIPESFSMRVDLYKNEVEVRYRAFMTSRSGFSAANGRINGIAGLRATGLTSTPGSPGSFQTPPDYPDRGTANWLLQAAAYFDPSLNITLNPTGGNLRAPGVVLNSPGMGFIFPEAGTTGGAPPPGP